MGFERVSGDMEIEFEQLAGGYRYDVLEDSCSGLDGAYARREDDAGVLIADNEDAVWNVWRNAKKIEEKAEDDGVQGVVDAAVAVQEAIEELFG